MKEKEETKRKNFFTFGEFFKSINTSNEYQNIIRDKGEIKLNSGDLKEKICINFINISAKNPAKGKRKGKMNERREEKISPTDNGIKKMFEKNPVI